VFGFAKRSLRSHPRINPSTQPAEGASTARSRAAAELTLILLSGEKQKRCEVGAALLLLLLFCRSEPAREGGPTADQFLAGGTQFQCGSEPARDGGLPTDLFLADVLIPTVGVSLLAMAVCQPTNFLLAALNSNVGASLLAKAA
jgi:hypothetical protein